MRARVRQKRGTLNTGERSVNVTCERADSRLYNEREGKHGWHRRTRMRFADRGWFYGRMRETGA